MRFCCSDLLVSFSKLYSTEISKKGMLDMAPAKSCVTIQDVYTLKSQDFVRSQIAEEAIVKQGEWLQPPRRELIRCTHPVY